MTTGRQTPTFQVIPGEKGLAAADPRAELRELYEKYGASVYSRCSYLLHDRAKAEDAMQDVFAKALTHFSSFRAESSPLTWLLKIATHHCLNILRGERASWRKRYESETKASARTDPGPQVFEMRELVGRMLSLVDPETQAIAIHYHVDEMTLEEVAALLDRSVPTVRKRLAEFAAICGKECST